MKYFELLRRRESVLQVYCAKKGLRDYIKKVIGIDFGYNHHIYVFNTWYLDKEEDEAFEKILEKKDNSFLKELIEKGFDVLKDLVDLSSAIKRKKLDNIDEIKEIYESFIEQYLKANAFLHLPLIIWEVLEKRFEKELEKKIDSVKEYEKFKKYLFILTSPKKESPVAEEQKELLKLSVDDIDKIKKHAEKYGWMNVHGFVGKSHDVDYYINRLKDIKDAKKQLKEAEGKIKNIESEKKKILDELQPSDKLLDLIELMQEYVYFRNYRRDVYSMSEANARGFFTEIGKRLGISYDEFICLIPEEAVDFIETNDKKYAELAKERLKEYAVDKDLKVYSGKGLDDVKKKYSFLKEQVEDVKEIKGDAASPGKVKGIVKVVLDVKELEKVKKGDILVANMTTPEYVVAMGKSAAIVTDRGGVLCHAAIVSREMGKPCVIGTRIATRVFNDGDRVEVDADKGVVRKMK